MAMRICTLRQEIIKNSTQAPKIFYRKNEATNGVTLLLPFCSLEMDERINRFRDLIARGRPYKVYNLVLYELRMVIYYGNQPKAAYQAHLGASFYDLRELDIDRGYKIKATKFPSVSTLVNNASK